MTMDRFEQGFSVLRKAHGTRHVPDIPLGFNGRVMADIQAVATGMHPLERLLPRFTVGAAACAALAMIYGLTLMDTVPQALAAMYVPSSGFGF